MNYLLQEIPKEYAYRYRAEPVYTNRTVNPEYDDPYYVRIDTKVVEDRYRIIKRTSKGFWIEYDFGKKFILQNARKHFACDNKKDAVISFLARQDKIIRITQTRIDNASRAIKLICDGKINVLPFL